MNFKKFKRIYLLILAVLLIAFAIGLATYLMRPKTPQMDGYVNTGEYKSTSPGEDVCQALMPGCGYCPGIVKDGYCLVPNDRL